MGKGFVKPLPQLVPRGGLLQLPTPRPSTLRAWLNLERLEEVGKELGKERESQGARGELEGRRAKRENGGK